MASSRVLVTGGAGFIGSHLVDALVARGHAVTVLDSIDPQTHPLGAPPHLNAGARYVHGDIRDRSLLGKLLRDVDVVFHEGARVGVGQSMYEISGYVDVNTHGTARLLDALVNEETSVKKLVVASSNTVYGEGAYQCPEHGQVAPGLRGAAQLAAHQWEVACPTCSAPLTPVPVPETKPLAPTSVYAITKRDQEELALTVGRAYGLPVVALRYFCVYGPRQTLSNPYTGVCAIFTSRIRNGQPPVVYEDGLQTRDFVNVRDVVRANLLAMERSGADYEAVNVGSGQRQSILGVAEALIRLYGAESAVKPRVEAMYREGDIRHCAADVSKARTRLGYEPGVTFEEGLRELAAWGVRAEAGADHFEDANRELAQRGLLRT